MERPKIRSIYRSGDAETFHAKDLLGRGRLTKAMLVQVEVLAREGHNYSWYPTQMRRGENGT